MIDLEMGVRIKWNGNSKSYFEGLGYKFSKLGEPFFVKIKHLTSGSRFLIPYTCDYCLMTYEDKNYINLLHQRKSINKDCCKNKHCRNEKRSEIFTLLATPAEEESFESLFPDIAKEWNYEKNSILPSQVCKRSAKSIWWICENGHEWQEKISARTKNLTKCKKCKKLNSNLKLLFPEIAKEWHSSKNGESQPTDFSPKSATKVWWQCTYGHEWETKIYNRTANNSGCPFCKNSLLTDYNSLAAINPDLAKEWSIERNDGKTANDVFPNTHEKYWWECSECHSEWKASPADRNSTHKTGCPICKESKGEKRVRAFLESNNISYERQVEYDRLVGFSGKSLRFDFRVTREDGSFFLMEYDGEYHYRCVYEGDDFEKTKEYDKRKNLFCMKNNLELVRIPYWEFNRIDDIVKKAINKE
ncbi:zinc-ribbon domain-containing protein [Bacillus infantis]|uniref:zinc-ribbon domain-containing protein n=1 Tax=Bacillus infantis TaxID=324767 RepID=UPI00209FC00F|nr:zinc-ribbon domain-containing protein [Bacillus infantis]MCP1159273.1 zinc-ribbon domain-containing protein [Bacillus infantis]